MPFPNKKLWQWQKCWLPTSSAISKDHGSYIATRAVTSSPVWYRRFNKTWEWVRRAPHSCTCNQTAWLSATSKLEKHLQKVVELHQRELDTRLPIFLLAYRAPTRGTTGLTPASLVFGRELWLSCNLLFGAPLGKEESTDHAENLVDHLHDIHNMPASTWSWPVTEWKLVMTDWRTAQATMRTTCASISPSAWKDSHPSISPHTG
jgi:hypothetical protein